MTSIILPEELWPLLDHVKSAKAGDLEVMRSQACKKNPTQAPYSDYGASIYCH